MKQVIVFAFIICYIALQCDGKYYLVNTKGDDNAMSQEEEEDEIESELLEKMKEELGDDYVKMDNDYQAAKKKMAVEAAAIGDDYVLPEKQKKKMLKALKGEDYYARKK